MSTLLGYLVAPSAAAVVMLGYLVLAWGMHGRPRIASRDMFALGLSLTVSYLWTALLGLPAHLVLRRRGLTRWWHYVAAGLALAIGPVFVYFVYRVVRSRGLWGFLSAWRSELYVERELVPFAGLCGVLVAATFWAIAVRPPRRG